MSAKNNVSVLCQEIRQRFPEIDDYVSSGDEKLAYTLMGYVARWLKSLTRQAITRDVTNRVQSFAQWCEDQPSGETAEDDILTIYTVSLYEELFSADTMHALLTKLTTKKELLMNADYLKAHVGEENYRKVLKQFG